MKHKPKDNILESLDRNCLTTPRSGSFLQDLVNLCEKMNDEMLFELIPIRLVAYLEDMLRLKYELVLRQPGKLKSVYEQNKKKLAIDSAELIDGTLPLSLQIAYSFGCNNLNEILDNIKTLTNIDLNKLCADKMGDDTWIKTRISIDSMFNFRHRLCHESVHGLCISKDCARTWIQDVGLLLNLIDIAIFNTVYKDYHFIKESDKSNKDIDSVLDENIQNAQKLFDDSEKNLDDILQLSITDNQYPKRIPNLDYISKWKEYRDKRVESENFFPIGSKQNVLYTLKEKTTYNNTLYNDLKIRYRDFINYATINKIM